MLKAFIQRLKQALITRDSSVQQLTSRSSTSCTSPAQNVRVEVCALYDAEEQFRERLSAALRAKVWQSSQEDKMFECAQCKSTYFDTLESLGKHLYLKHNIVVNGEVEVASVEKTDVPAGVGLPTEDAARKRLKGYTYQMEYFPDALLAEIEVAVRGNEQHNPGQPLHWAREKSSDQMNTAWRHQFDYGRGIKKDTDGQWHLAKAIWRLKAQLQLDIEEERRNNADV